MHMNSDEGSRRESNEKHPVKNKTNQKKTTTKKEKIWNDK